MTMPKFQPEFANSLNTLAIAYRSARRSQSTRALIETMFALLDAKPAGLSAQELQDRVPSAARNSGILETFKKVQCAELKERRLATRGRPAKVAIANSRLEAVADGYNQLYLQVIDQHVGDTETIDPQDIMERSVRKMAVSHGLPFKGPLEDIADMVGAKVGMHPLTVTYRALGGFACDFNVSAAVDYQMKNLLIGRETLSI